MKVLLPFPPDELGEPLPEGVTAVVWDGEAPPPPGLEDVEVYVPPYVGHRDRYELMARLPSLRVVQTLTAGVDAVRPYVPAGVTLCNARGVHDTSTAELAVALVLAWARGLPEFLRRQQRQEWHQEFLTGLADRTVLVLGYGSIGAAVERRLSGFEVEILRVARTARPGQQSVHGLDELPEVLPQADVIVVTVPMTDDTHHLVDATFLSRMKDGALLVNVSRGPVVDTEALLAELTSRRLHAALDVTDPEPLPPGHPLWTAPNLVLTPHVGGGTAAFLPRARRLLVEQLRRLASGADLLNVVTGEY